MNLLAELVVSAFLVSGGFFLLVGAFGLAKLPDTLRRLHGPTKSTTLGVGSVLIASMLFALFERGHLSIHELLITLFLFLTAPVSANLIAKAHLRRTDGAGTVAAETPQPGARRRVPALPSRGQGADRWQQGD